MYYLYIIVLENCPYSMAALELLDSLNIKYKRLSVSATNKDTYKTKEINTFPQIYLKKTVSNHSILLGGYDKLKQFIDIFINKPYDEKNIIKYNKENKLWTKKLILRLMEIMHT